MECFSHTWNAIFKRAIGPLSNLPQLVTSMEDIIACLRHYTIDWTAANNMYIAQRAHPAVPREVDAGRPPGRLMGGARSRESRHGPTAGRHKPTQPIDIDRRPHPPPNQVIRTPWLVTADHRSQLKRAIQLADAVADVRALIRFLLQPDPSKTT